MFEAREYFPDGPDSLPRGAIVAVGILTAVVPTEGLVDKLMPREEFFGNYDAGRFGWLFDSIRPLSNPVPATGRLGIWTMPPEVIAAVRDELHAAAMAR